MKVPAAYQDLLQITGPKMLVVAMGYLGVKEITGRQNEPIIMGWIAALDAQSPQALSSFLSSDEVPWCGTFQAYCAMMAGWDYPKTFYRALDWAAWGNKADKAMLGDTLVFKRKGGGHVGQYVGEDDEHYHVLGGNQSNAVTIMLLEKSRCVAVRRAPWRIAQPADVKVIRRAPQGAISKNEA